MATTPESERMARRHLALGFGGLALFVLLGLALEGLHAFKVGFYLDQDQVTRRLLLRLSHAHGGVLSIVHLAFGLAAGRHPEVAQPLASRALILGLVLVPAGFALGALGATASDPGLLVLLVPAGAVALLYGLIATARALLGGARAKE